MKGETKICLTPCWSSTLPLGGGSGGSSMKERIPELDCPAAHPTVEGGGGFEGGGGIPSPNIRGKWQGGVAQIRSLGIFKTEEDGEGT